MKTQKELPRTIHELVNDIQLYHNDTDFAQLKMALKSIEDLLCRGAIGAGSKECFTALHVMLPEREIAQCS